MLKIPNYWGHQSRSLCNSSMWMFPFRHRFLPQAPSSSMGNFPWHKPSSELARLGVAPVEESPMAWYVPGWCGEWLPSIFNFPRNIKGWCHHPNWRTHIFSGWAGWTTWDHRFQMADFFATAELGQFSSPKSWSKGRFWRAVVAGEQSDHHQREERTIVGRTQPASYWMCSEMAMAVIVLTRVSWWLMVIYGDFNSG